MPRTPSDDEIDSASADRSVVVRSQPGRRPAAHAVGWSPARRVRRPALPGRPGLRPRGRRGAGRHAPRSARLVGRRGPGGVAQPPRPVVAARGRAVRRAAAHGARHRRGGSGRRAGRAARRRGPRGDRRHRPRRRARPSAVRSSPSATRAPSRNASRCRPGTWSPSRRSCSFAEAACLPTAWLTAYRMLFTSAGLRPGDRVLVQGAGGGVSSARHRARRRRPGWRWSPPAGRGQARARRGGRRRGRRRAWCAAAVPGRRGDRDGRRGHLVALGHGPATRRRDRGGRCDQRSTSPGPS